MIKTAKVIHFKDWDNSYIPNILKEIYLDKVYQPYLQYMQDKIVFDLGCNIGLFSLFAAEYAKQVYAFEPATEAYNLATANLNENEAKNVQLFKMAVSAEDGKATFHINTNTTMNSLNPAVNDHKQTEEVETVRLDTFVKESKIDHIGFMKVDVEGTEDKLFVSESFQNIVPMLDSFVYEYHNWCQSPAHLINEALNDYGYDIKQIPSEATIFGAIKK